ncbi:MAG TPA: DUF4097 family beta strand repeat-containing protein [Acidobacteriaceae bacterium]|nr:DUF4097 family beta strand repeat-containing protein [Acidobacteriaceae bacterium]
MIRLRSLTYLAATALLTPLLAHAATDKTFQRTLNVTATPDVIVQTGSGDIHISQGTSNQVAITGTIHMSHWGWGSTNDKDVDQIVNNPPIQQSGNTIKIGFGNGGSSFFSGNDISIDYDIRIPNGANLKINSGSGDVRIEGINASLHAETGSGDINVKGSSLTEAQAETGSGNIQLDAVQGHLRAHTGSGDVTAAGTPNADWYLETGSGDVNLTVPSSSKFRLDAQSSSGDIHSDVALTMQGNLNRGHVSGSANGGGPTIRVETGSGDINIH